MTSQINEKSPAFLDYKIRNVVVLNAKQKELNTGDLVTDSHGIIGIVKFQTEQFGNFIEFIDGFTAYDSGISVSKMSVQSLQYFEHHRHYFGFITKLGRILSETLTDDFPYVNLFNNGSVLYVRGSTMGQIVQKFTHAPVGLNHSLISIALTPFYNCHFEILDVKKALRNSKFTYELLRKIFIDIDLQMRQSMKLSFEVTDQNDYNMQHWKKVLKQFKKFKVKYPYKY